MGYVPARLAQAPWVVEPAAGMTAEQRPAGPGAQPVRRILLADADAFYVAVARQVDPEGAGRARLLLVGGSPEGRGVVTSASYETRAYGVRSAMPMAQALRLCPGATVVGVPRRACAEKSAEIRAELERHAPIVEPASIDEFYLDLTGTESLYGGEPLVATARRIRDAVLAASGITLSLGGGTSKLIAKLAAERAKPHRGGDGVCVVDPENEATFLSGLELAAIPGVGPKFAERLMRRGLVMVPDALALDRATMTHWFGPGTGAWLYDRIRGVDGSAVVSHGVPKSVSREETFARDLSTDAALERELLDLAVRVAGDLRRHGLTARTVTVKLRDHDFTTRTARQTLRQAVTTDRPIREAARRLLQRLRAARRVPARLIGVALSGLSADAGAPTTEQLQLFDDPDHEPLETERERALTEAVDRIGARFGREHLVRGRQLTRPGE